MQIMYTPVNSSFTIQKWGLRGSKLYTRVLQKVLSLIVFFSFTPGICSNASLHLNGVLNS